MPAYKRQHYLPCAYLKNFSPDGSQATRTSHVWRIDECRAVFVPVESQCAGDYFFSKSAAEESEKEFQAIEAGYATSVAKIWSGGAPTAFEYLAMIVAAFDLYARNAVHENRTSGEGSHAYQLRTRSLMNRLVLGNYAPKALPPADLFDGLKKFWAVRLFVTPPGRQIVTSDHPALIFNWGESEEIDFLLMPVTSTVCAAVFDRRTTIPLGNGLTEEDGATLFHALATHAGSCLYCDSEPNGGLVESFRALWKKRTHPNTVTDDEKWSLDLIVPQRKDQFSFIRPS